MTLSNAATRAWENFTECGEKIVTVLDGWEIVDHNNTGKVYMRHVYCAYVPIEGEDITKKTATVNPETHGCRRCGETPTIKVYGICNLINYERHGMK